ncbi:MAG: hypothetical protein WC619_05650 [Patescibacteria group bacterium]
MEEKNKKISNPFKNKYLSEANGVNIKKETGPGKIVLIILIVAIALEIVIGASYIFRNYLDRAGDGQGVTVPDGQNPGMIIGGDKDGHGCLGPAGYSWCEAKSKCLRIFEEFCPDAVYDLVSQIEKNSGIKFSSKVEGNSGAEIFSEGETEFNWIVGEGDRTADVKIAGLLYEASGVKMADYEKIKKYLNENAELDLYNLADGVVSGLRGYFLDYMVCGLNFRWAEFKKNSEGLEEPVGDKLNVKLECGYFNKNDISEIILEQEIEELFGEKYKKIPSSIKVNITMEEESHIRGGVTFLDPSGKPGEGGNFFAVKIDGEWQIVFDGNGGIPCTLAKYGFTSEMLFDCF